MSDDTFPGLAAWLALNRLTGLGGARFRALTTHLPHPAALFGLDDAALQAAGFPALLRQSIAESRLPGSVLREAVHADLGWLGANPEVAVLPWDDPAYPPLLRELADPPPVLFVRGDPGHLLRPQLALVGSRQCTRIGRETAFSFARALAAHGLGITSGLALGIDGEAHRGALAAGGITVAVLAHGLDRVYPPRHAPLAADILAAGGTLVSEFPPGSKPLAHHFLQRNRIISGLAMGVLVIEATVQSGSLVTARLAMEQGREVFAIPGSIHQPQSRGCHRLIRDGAALVETVDDILAELGGFRPLPVAGPVTGDAAVLGKPMQALLDCIEYAPTAIDAMVQRSGMDTATVMAFLTELELAGMVAPEAGGYSRIVTQGAPV